jgi:hypothetical protein
MKNSWPTGPGLSVIVAGVICLSGCSSLPTTSTNTAPATVAYMVGNVDTAIKGYSAVAGNNTSPVDTLTYPPSYYGGPLATDASGQIYVAVAIDPIDPSNLGDIFIYPPNPTGAATPSRTIDIGSYGVAALAVDPAGLLYVANNGSTASTVTVYSTTAIGTATPLRTLQLTNVGVIDIAADAGGNMYVAGPMGTEQVVAVYPPTATGPSTPTRTITLVGYSRVFGVAVDPAGHIFASVWPGYSNGAGYVIEEFAPEASGAATPINTINLNVGSPWTIIGGGPVRLDGAGNIFTSLFLTNPVNLFTDVIYGYEPTATSDAAPFVQITPTDRYNTFFALN